jgi:hypothetical protein
MIQAHQRERRHVRNRSSEIWFSRREVAPAHPDPVRRGAVAEVSDHDLAVAADAARSAPAAEVPHPRAEVAADAHARDPKVVAGSVLAERFAAVDPWMSFAVPARRV